MFCACAVTVTTSPKSKTRPAFLNRFSIKSSSAHLSGRRKAKSNKETCTFGMGFEDRLQKMFQPETGSAVTLLWCSRGNGSTHDSSTWTATERCKSVTDNTTRWCPRKANKIPSAPQRRSEEHTSELQSPDH